MDNGLGNLPKVVQVMVVVCGKIGWQLMQVAFRNTVGDLENLIPNRRMWPCFALSRRRPRSHTGRFLRLLPVHLHKAIITRASGRGNVRLPAPSPSPFPLPQGARMLSCGWRRPGAKTVAPPQDVQTPRRGTARRAPTCSYPTSRLCTQVATATKPIDTSTRIADSAFTSGVTADLSIPYTLIGSVVEPTPAVKKLMMKSSSESVNAISSAPMMPGTSSGSVTRLKATQGVAPRSSAASSSRGSSLRRRARTLQAPTGKLEIVCGVIIATNDSGSLVLTKNNSIATPIMISGMTMGMSKNPSNAPCQRNGCRSNATAVSTPSPPATTVETVATMRLFTVAASSAWSVNSVAYHCNEKPCQRAESFEALNEKTISIAIGRERDSRSATLAATRQDPAFLTGSSPPPRARRTE